MGKEPKLFFITPVHQRYELTKICLEQRQREMSILSESYGIDARCVVVGDDDNMHTAAQLGFDTVIQNNEFLGRRWNDGYEHALTHNADFVMPVGSDSWVKMEWAAGFILTHSKMADRNAIAASRNYAVVHKTAQSRVQVWVPVTHGVHFVIPARLLEATNGRPCREELQSGCDNSTFRALGMGTQVMFNERHKLESVAFQSDVQITNYNKLREKWGKEETQFAFEGLAEQYGEDMVEKITRFYGNQLEKVKLQQMRDAEGPMTEKTGLKLIDEIRGLKDALELPSFSVKNNDDVTASTEF